MTSTLGTSSTTLHQIQNDHLDLEDLDATMVLEDIEAFLVEELHPLSPIGTSDDQDAEELISNNKTNKSSQGTEADRRQFYRRREKRGREELRRQVVALNEELTRVRDAKENEKAQFNAAQTPTFWFWKSVAIRQRHERSLAEEEQRALTASVHAQAAYIRTLAKITRTAENNSFALSEQGEAVNGHNKQRCGVSEPELFDAGYGL